MAKSKYKNWEEVRRTRFSEAEIAETDRNAGNELLRHDLRELRKLAGKTQVEVAAAMDAKQSDVSKYEAGADHRLSTLRRYVEALGGQLELVARLENKSIVLSL